MAILALAAAVAGFAFAGVRYAQYRDSRRDQSHRAQLQAQVDTRNAAMEAGALLNALTTAVDSLAGQMTDEITRLAGDPGVEDPVRQARGAPLPRLPAIDAPPAGRGADAPLCATEAGLEDLGLSDVASRPWLGIEIELCLQAATIPNLNGIGATFQVDPQRCPPLVDETLTDMAEWEHFRRGVVDSLCYQPYALLTRGDFRMRWPNVERHIHRGDELAGYLCDKKVDDPGPCVPRDWYGAAVAAGEGVWSDSRFGATSLAMLGFYSAPFFDGDRVAGVIFGTFRLDDLALSLNWLEVVESGYPFIFDGDAVYIGHPEQARFICSQRLDGSLGRGVECDDFDYTEIEHGSSTRGVVDELARAGPEGECGLLRNYRDVMTGEEAWIAFEPITFQTAEATSCAEASAPPRERTAPAWTFASVVFEDEVLARTDAQTRAQLDIGLGVLFGTFALSVVLIAPRVSSHTSLWAAAASVSIAATLAILWIWGLTATAPPAEEPIGASGERVDGVSGEVRPVCSADPVAEARGCVESADLTTSVVRAGVLVQSVEFEGANDVLFHGVAWQEYRDRENAESPQLGFVLPEADSVQMNVLYDTTLGPVHRIGWSFTASLRQSFDYASYPFDREDVWLRLWPAEFVTETLLVPDVLSYQLLARSAKPGIDEGLVLQGWRVDGSYFQHRRPNYAVNFSPRNCVEAQSDECKPDLYFNISIKREFINPFFTVLIPLIVVLLMLFAVLLVAKPEDRHDFQDTMAALGFSAGLFFVVILSQVNVRSRLSADGLIYLEYFHLAAYLAIFFVSINAVLIWAGRGGRVIHYDDNLIPELLYWPALTLGLLTVTIISF